MILSTPAIPETASSIFWVTWDSIVFASTPGYIVLMVTIGKSTFG